MNTLQGRFDRAVQRLVVPAGPAWVAVSGGPDSVALLHLLVRSEAARHLTLVVAHVDHGIHPDSARVAEAVAALASGLGLPCRSTRLGLGPGTTETRAREARYRWLLHEAAAAGAVVLTAHNRDDQVETILMRFLGGSGLAGLAGMAARVQGGAASAGAGQVLRPLLGVGRTEIRDWVAAEGFTVWEDPSNVEPSHLRGWLRTALLPVAEARDPAVRDRILRVAEAARMNRSAWDHLLEVLPVDPRVVSDGISVASVPLRDYDFPLALCLVLAAAQRAGLSIGPGRARRILALVRRGRVGARIDIGRGWIAELNRDRLAVVRPAGPGAGRVAVGGPAGHHALGEWDIRWAPSAAPASRRDGWSAWVIPGEYEVTAWRPGDRIRPLGGTGSRLVVRCMQDGGVPRRLRPRWPVVRRDGEVVWVPGVCRSDAAVPPEGGEAMRIDVELT